MAGPLAKRSEEHDGDGPAGTGAESVGHALGEGVASLHHEQRAAEDGAVHGQQRQIDTQALLQRRRVAIEHHVEDLHRSCNHADERDEAHEGQIEFRQTGPAERARSEQQLIDGIVQRHGQRLHGDDGYAEPDGRLHPLRHGQIGAHAEQEDEGQVLHQHGGERDVEESPHSDASR